MKTKLLPALLLLSGLLANPLFADDPPSVPGAPGLSRNGFNRLDFLWSASTDDVGVAGYKIFRNGSFIATAYTNSYSDTTVAPGITYVYTIVAFDDASNESAPSGSLTVRTIENPSFEGSELVKQVVDMAEPWGLAPEDLITAVQGIFAQLGSTGLDFTQIDPGLLADLLESQFAIISEPQDPVTDEQRVLDQQELDLLLAENFPGHSFLDIYAYLMLTVLGEDHWQNNSPEAADTLYNFALEFLPDHEVSVFNVLCRLGQFKTIPLIPESSRAEILSAAHANRDELMRFFDFFPDSVSGQAQNAFARASAVYFTNFPSLLLPYDAYEASAFDAALSAAQCALALNPSAANQRRLNRIAAWELNSMQVSFLNLDGSPMQGTLSVSNSSPPEPWPSTPAPSDSRLFPVDASPASFPLFKGHSYDLTASISILGGPAIQYRAPSVPHAKGKKITYSHGQSVQTEDLPDPAAPCQVVFVSKQPAAPYNLSAQKSLDTFTLSWDWAPIQGFELKEFKVYRAGNYIGTATSQSLSGIPLDSADHTYTYTVRAFDIYDLPSDESLPLEVLPDNLSEEQLSYLAWKQIYFGTDPMFDYQDPDNDGLTNLQEYNLGSNPTVAPVVDVKSTLQNVSSGCAVKYFSGTWTSLPNFATLSPLSSDTLPDGPSFASTSGNILSSGIPDYIHLSATAYFDAPAPGWHRFFLGSDDGSKLYIDNMLLVANDGKHSYREYVGDIYLSQGVHAIRIDYFDYETSARLQLDWTGPGFARTPMNAASLWSTTDSSPVLAEAIAWNTDSDRDGLTDHEETLLGTNRLAKDSDNDSIPDFDEVKTYGTNPLLADSDGDGVSDFDEINSSRTNPLTPEMDLSSVETVAIVNGAAYASCVGDWVKSGTAAFSRLQRGSLSYVLDAPTADIYRVEIKLRERFNISSSFDLTLSMDGERLDRMNVIAGSGTVSAFTFTPHLAAGQHGFSIFWDGYKSFSSLQVESVSLQRIGGPDGDENGVADWKQVRLDNMCSVDLDLESSRTSPLCLEGRGNFLSLMGGVTPSRGVGGRWFADVPLSPSSPTTVAVSFQNGAKTVSKTISWTETNILSENGASITIRKGDSLLLNARPDGAAPGSFVITHGGQQYSGPVSTPLELQFPEAGSFPVSGSYTAPDGQVQSASIAVNVIGYGFGSPSPACWKDHSRTWDFPLLPPEASLDMDAELSKFFLSAEQPAGMSRGYLCSSDNEGHAILSRLGEGGPVLAATIARSVDVFSSNLTYVRQSELYEDGTRVYEMLVISSPVLQDVVFNLRIFVAGITFDDGTIEKNLSAPDFDELGMAKVHFIYPPEARTSVCHNLKLYQNGEYMGMR